MVRKLTLLAIPLALVVIILGAYTRLTDAGLGCPDWPGCYGHLGVPQSAADINAANQAFPERAVEPHKAWNEMIHRYFAGSLGLVILLIFVLSARQYVQRSVTPLRLPLFLLLLVVFQAMLGMWTVTMKLNPLVVMAHLLGGFSTLALLVLLLGRLSTYPRKEENRLTGIHTLGLLALVVLFVQIALGGWTSANYAALVCTHLPICEADWAGRLNFADAFSLPQGHEDYEFGKHDYDSRMTIHITHRIGAMLTFLVVGIFAFQLWLRSQSPWFRHLALAICSLLLLQVLLGVANVSMSLPLGIAVAHNAIAACLLMSLVLANYWIRQRA